MTLRFGGQLGEPVMGNFYTDIIKKDPRFKSLKAIHDMGLLEPVTRQLVQQIIADAAAQGIKLMAYETYRSQERQAQLFAQGATKLKTVGTHHYGISCDLVKDVGGEPSWKGDFKFLGHAAAYEISQVPDPRHGDVAEEADGAARHRSRRGGDRP